MSDQNWTETVKNFKSSLKLILNRLSGGEVNVELISSLTGNEEKTAEFLSGAKLFKCIEERFQIEILLGYKGDWSFMIEAADNQYSHPELSIANILSDFAGELLSRLGSELKLGAFGGVEPDSTINLLNLQQYHMVSWQTGEGDAELLLALSTPNEQVSDLLSKLTEDAVNLGTPGFIQLAEETAGSVFTAHSSNKKSRGVEHRPEPNGNNVEFEAFDKSSNIKNFREIRNIDLLKDVEMEVSVELGRKKIPLGKILQLVKGSVIELEKLAGEPVDLLVNGRCIAQGEVVVIDEHFGIRISNLLSAHNTIKLGA